MLISANPDSVATLAVDTSPVTSYSRIGVISDTHGLLRPEALETLLGCDQIIHAGDIGKLEVLRQLAELSPVTAVRGNNDQDSWAKTLPFDATIAVGPVNIHVIHDLAQLTLDPVLAGFHVVISGHSHKPRILENAGVLYLNPGSAGPRRFRLPVSIGELMINDAQVQARIITLDV